MERQLKERLIGAAVLVAAAVIMVPEMFSGTHSRSQLSDGAAQPLQTYRIDLQAARRSEASTTASVATPDAPAERPQREAEVASNSESTSGQAAVATSTQMSERSPAEVKPEISTAVRLEPKPVYTKSVQTKPIEPAPSESKVEQGDWQVQVGSFSNEAKARQIAATLKSQGFVSSVAPVKVTDKTLYRVRVGAAAPRSVADATLQKLRATYPGASVVAANR